MLLYGRILTTTAKVGTIQQNYNVTGEVNLRVKAKGFTHKVMQRNNIVSSWMIQQKNIMSKILVYTQLMLFFSHNVVSFTLSGKTFRNCLK